jgi:serine kinase of HPr protein (carbohydrate metabolism regulator)
MNRPNLSSETLHASCVALGGRAILILGRSGSGKSDLALRLVDRGAVLVSDDYVIVRRVGGKLVAGAPPTIEGKMEVRGVGLIEMKAARDVPVGLAVDLDGHVDRMPDRQEPLAACGMKIPLVALAGFEASAPLKAELALVRFGIPVE